MSLLTSCVNFLELVSARQMFHNTSQMKTIAACVAGVALMAFAAVHLLANDDDFRQFYRAARLARTHESVFAHPTLSPVTNTEATFLPYNRIPSYAVALEPLAALPYPAARRIWIATSILAFFGCVWLSPVRRDRFAIALAFSFPVALTFVLGQDIGFVVLIALAAARIYSMEREFLAGLVASLLAIKLTYLPAASLVFLTKSRRGSMGMAVGIALQLAVSFAIGGIGWPSEYLAMLRTSLHVFDPRNMPNMRALITSLSLPGGAYLAGAIVLLAWLWWACGRLSLPEALIVGLPLGLIASPYCFLYDSVVLVPLLVSVVSLDSWDGLLAGAALTPIPFFLLMVNSSVSLLVGSVLVVASPVAAAVRFLRLRNAAGLSDGSMGSTTSPSYG